MAKLDTRTVVIALRSDRLADLAAHPNLGRHVEEGLHLVAGLGEEGLRQAVEAPARQAGLHLEPGLVDLLVREVEGDPGALPLLSHALRETWKHREGPTLHRRRLPHHRRDPRRRREVSGDDSMRRPIRAPTAVPQPGAASGDADRTASRSAPGCRADSSPPTPSTSGWSTRWWMPVW